ncbi:MAG: molybdopterin oxidoreductase family protein [Alphaproteobacteria bacterium]
MLESLAGPSEKVDTSPVISDEVKTTTCYMCACRCGIKVHLKDGGIRYIEGNKKHPVNKGVLCAKGSAGIMQHFSPARLTKPLRRVGPRGSGEFEEISWDEAMGTATQWLSNIRNTDPKKLAFFTGRDQSQSLTGFWAQQFGTPNFAAHGGFCSVNMAAGGIYTVGGSFWEFGEPDWEHTKYFMMFGVAEDHDSNPIKTGLGKLKTRGAKVVAVNPVRTGYAAIADEWIGIRPGTDGLFVLAIVHELLKADKVDLEYLARYTNSSWLVRVAPGEADNGLFVRDEDGDPLAWDRTAAATVKAQSAGTQPTMVGEVTLPDGRKAVPSFQLMAERYLADEYAPDAVADRCGIPADQIRSIAADLAHVAFEETVTLDVPWTDWTGRQHDTMVGRPVAIHAMRGISAHTNGFHTCRALHLLQMVLGAVDTPGSFRYKPPFPRPAPPGPKPAGKPEHLGPNKPMPGPPLGFTAGPEDLLLDENGGPMRIDHAYSWKAPLSAHGMMHMVIHNAWEGNPYKVDTLFMYMANMGWNSSMNTDGTIAMLTDTDPETGEYKIPRIIYSDAFWSETVAYADLILPDTTYLERWDAVSLLDRPISSAHGPADAIRQPIVKPDRDVRPFQDVVIDLGYRLGLPGFTNDDGTAKFPKFYPDYLVNHTRGAADIGPLAGFRGLDGNDHGRGAPNVNQLERYIENDCFWSHELDANQLYFKNVNKDYLEWSASLGFIPNAKPIILQIYSETLQKFRLAAQGHGDIIPPEEDRERIETYFDPLPIWYAPFEEAAIQADEFPLHAITQRPAAMYHSWGSQNAWLRQIHGSNPLFVPRALGEKHGLEDGDWARLTSHHGSIVAPVKLMEGVNKDTVWTWNAIGKRKGAWNLDEDAPEANKGFLLNQLISELLPDKKTANADPVTGQAAWYDLRVRIEKVAASEIDGMSTSRHASLKPHRSVVKRPDILRYGKASV